MLKGFELDNNTLIAFKFIPTLQPNSTIELSLSVLLNILEKNKY